MSSLRMKRREERRVYLVKKYSKKRKLLLSIIRNPKNSLLEKEKAQAVLQKLPKDASPIRMHNRCKLTGRPKGYIRQLID